MAKLMERIKDIDVYQLLDIPPDADEKIIKKAYRKKALACHPDKNPDNPRAAEEFHTLSDAYELLTDADAKKAYDNLLKARKANELRNRQLDAKRRKLKEDLENREKAAREETVTQFNEEQKLQQEIERLRRQGRMELEKEQERMRREIEEEMKSRPSANKASAVPEVGAKLKLKWRESDPTKPTYSEPMLRAMFSKYGQVKNVVMLTGKKGKMSGLVDMASLNAATLACQNETGLLQSPISVKLLDGSDAKADQPREETFTKGDPNQQPQTPFDLDAFEAMVMKKMEQAEADKHVTT